MARRWDDKDGNGHPLTDGRMCLVITSDSDPDMPEQRIYGKDKDEIIDKAANTIATGQSTIHRLRKQPPATPARPATSAAPSAEVAKAVTDLSNPQTAPAAVKTLLGAAGVDVNAGERAAAIKRVADTAEKWERENPDYPKDPRNDQILMNKAALVAGGALRITADHITAAYEELTRKEMFFEPKPGSTVQPEGTPDSRTGREATSYRRNALRASEPTSQPAKESTKEQKFRTILEDGTGKDVENAIKAEKAGNREYAGFQDYANKLYAKTA